MEELANGNIFEFIIKVFACAGSAIAATFGLLRYLEDSFWEGEK